MDRAAGGVLSASAYKRSLLLALPHCLATPGDSSKPISIERWSRYPWHCSGSFCTNGAERSGIG